MKKQLLFIIPSLNSGGAEKSLISLLSLFDNDKYDVDLLLFRREGLFLEKVPNEVRLVGDVSDYEAFDAGCVSSVKYFLFKGKFITALNRLRYARAFSQSDAYTRDKKLWSFLKKVLPKLDKRYDCAVGYLEGNASLYAVECADADKKICFFHNDFKKLGLDETLCREIFGKADSIVTVSAECKKSLDAIFGEFTDKIHIIENIISPKLIRSEAECTDVYDKLSDETVILTVGRCSPQKGIDIAVRAAAELKERGLPFKWYHIGAGELFDETAELVKSLDVSDRFIMLGERSGPYPYIGQCDIYVQPSRFEGKSIAIDEAKCLCRPIVVTDFPTVSDQITDGLNGIVCKAESRDIADRVEMLIKSPSLRKSLSDELLREDVGNESEIEKFYSLL